MIKHEAQRPGSRGTSQVRIVSLGDARLIFVGGQVAVDDSGSMVGVGDFATQCEVVFSRLLARLNEAQASAADIVKLGCFLTSFDDFEEFVRIRQRHLPVPGPASSAVEVSRLVDPAMMVEVEAIAITGAHDLG